MAPVVNPVMQGPVVAASQYYGCNLCRLHSHVSKLAQGPAVIPTAWTSILVSAGSSCKSSMITGHELIFLEWSKTLTVPREVSVSGPGASVSSRMLQAGFATHSERFVCLQKHAKARPVMCGHADSAEALNRPSLSLSRWNFFVKTRDWWQVNAERAVLELLPLGLALSPHPHTDPHRRRGVCCPHERSSLHVFDGEATSRLSLSILCSR